ncbi:uncharacterized protein LOC135688867 isoform X2 [Rhopilema esculentum]|uniref:uncharacterized protein LOC135688867 isoform X2 n=1 Tax=Rhopilema esculentum TaxID=499914 RepID=UPI0031E231FE
MKLPLQLLEKKKKFDREPPKRPSAKIHYICGEKFKVVRPLARDMFDAVSFTVIGKTSWFLRVRGQYCFLEPKKQSRQFEKDCSFFPLVNLWFPEFVSFESVQKSAHYLRMKDGRLILDHYDGTTDFKEEASFKMGLKNDFICKINEARKREEDKPLLHEDAYRCSSAGMSDCVCSECVSVVSFQIYEENTHICECSDCETDYVNKRLGKNTK